MTLPCRRGFPVGYLLFWENAQTSNVKQIGIVDKQHTVPYRLIVDGQPRLTSLYAVFESVAQEARLPQLRPNQANQAAPNSWHSP